MSLLTNLQNLINAQGTTVKNLRTSISGASTDDATAVTTKLTTTAGNVVGAINENKVAIDASVAAAVTSVNGVSGPGAVAITTTDVSELGNLYFVPSRVLATQISNFTGTAGTVTTADTLGAAISKLSGNIDAFDPSDIIDDVTPSTTTVFSSTQTNTEIASAVAAVIDSSPGALDTLNELAAAMGDDANFSATMTNALALKANIADTFSVAELGTGIDAHDFSADWATAIA